MSVSSGDPAQVPGTSERPKKLQRISQACDLCHRRSIRCRPSNENPQVQCQNCFDFGVPCTYNRPSRRRRNPSVSHRQGTPPNILPNQRPSAPKSPTEAASDGVNGTLERSYNTGPDYTGAFSAVREGYSDDDLISWRAFAFASLDTIERLLRIYMDDIYPIFPIFHGPTLWERIRNRIHLSDRGFFASVMGACALAAARARDGALVDHRNIPRHGLEQQSEIFYSGAACALFKDFNKAQGLGYLRACALLALTAIQYGQIASMHQYLGNFCTLSAMQQFHDESHWPQDLTITETEECRRLYWSMYKLDTVTAVVFNGVLRFQETSANVRYPAEVNDEHITQAGFPSNAEGNWLRGWNATTDLVRVLEHTIMRVRNNHQSLKPGKAPVLHFLAPEHINNTTVMDEVVRLYYQLPARFRDYSVPVTGNAAEDLYGFQAASVQVAFQLVRIILSSVHTNHDMHQKCAVVEELLSTLHSISPRFLTAISSPLVYVLGGIGHILATIIEGSLTEDAYQRVRSSLVSMANLLENLESGLQPTAGASKGLRSQIDKIDHFMQGQRTPSAFGSHLVDPQPMTTTFAPRQRPVISQSQQGILGQSVSGHPVPSTSNQFQVPQEVIGPWPWPFEQQNDHQHPVNNMPGFGG